MGPTKIKNFDREDFSQRGRKERPLVASPKKKFNLWAKLYKKPLSLIGFAAALEEIVPNSVLFTALSEHEIDLHYYRLGWEAWCRSKKHWETYKTLKN